MQPASTQTTLHSRNAHRHGYDFESLITACPALGPHVRPNPYGIDSINFADPLAVKRLNQALLQQYYGVHTWDIPPGYLCPPIPGRVDYVHYLADLLGVDTHDASSAKVKLLDIGTGANLIYPLLATTVYGWQCVGVDVDANALAHAQQLIDANGLASQISLRQQPRATSIFKGVLLPDDQFTLTMCNPPFHASHAHARAGTQRKWRGLGKAPAAQLNFGGQAHELVYPGGEAQFLNTMLRESRMYGDQCLWFSSLVSKASLLPMVYRTLTQLQARTVHTIAMAQGQKQSRFVAWQF